MNFGLGLKQRNNTLCDVHSLLNVVFIHLNMQARVYELFWKLDTNLGSYQLPKIFFPWMGQTCNEFQWNQLQNWKSKFVTCTGSRRFRFASQIPWWPIGTSVRMENEWKFCENMCFFIEAQATIFCGSTQPWFPQLLEPNRDFRSTYKNLRYASANLGSTHKTQLNLYRLRHPNLSTYQPVFLGWPIKKFRLCYPPSS